MIRAAVIFANYGPYHMARARGLARVAGIDACFVELGTEQDSHPWQVDRRGLDIDLHTLVQGPYDQVPFREVYRRLVGFLDAVRPDALVIPSYQPPIMLAAAAWARRHDTASILMYETTECDRPRRWWKEIAKRFVVQRYFDAAFVGGSASLEYLVKLGMPVSRIWTGCDVVDNAAFGVPGGTTVGTGGHLRCIERPSDRFLYVGRFAPEKNLLRLLRAYALYRRGRSLPWGLVLVGDGPEREQVLRTLALLSLDDVRCPGFAQLEELVLHYAMSSALILPSTSEPWGLVVNEAMASGLPVLVSNRCGSARDLVLQGRNGFVFDPHDVDDISMSMAKMSEVSPRERRAMSNCSRQIIAAYTPERWGDMLAECIVEGMREVRRSGVAGRSGTEHARRWSSV